MRPVLRKIFLLQERQLPSIVVVCTVVHCEVATAIELENVEGEPRVDYQEPLVMAFHPVVSVQPCFTGATVSGPSAIHAADPLAYAMANGALV